GVQTCALPITLPRGRRREEEQRADDPAVAPDGRADLLEGRDGGPGHARARRLRRRDFGPRLRERRLLYGLGYVTHLNALARGGYTQHRLKGQHVGREVLAPFQTDGDLRPGGGCG